jgi:hypothetical protein
MDDLIWEIASEILRPIAELMIYRPGYLILQWFNPKATIEPERLLTFLCGLGFWSAIGVIVWGIALF